MSTKSPYSDRDILICSVLFAFVGVGYLFPFSALTQPVDYWEKVFPDRNIEFPLVTLYMWTNLICLFVVVFCTTGEPSYTFRFVLGFLGQIIVLVAVPSFYFLHLAEETHYYCVLFATAIAAIVTALIDSVAISFAAQYPDRIQQSFQFGIGLSTLIGSIFRLTTKAAFPPEQVIASSLFYFYCGAVTVLLCVVAYFILLTLPISKEFLKFGIDSSHHNHSETDELSHILSNPNYTSYSLLENQESDKIGHHSNNLLFPSIITPSNELEMILRTPTNKNKLNNSIINSDNTTIPFNSPHSETFRPFVMDVGVVMSPISSSRKIKLLQHHRNKSSNIASNNALPQTHMIAEKLKILQRIWLAEVWVFTVFASTLVLWPPMITEIKSFNFPVLQETRWWPLLLLAIFSISDCFGRLSTGHRMYLTRDNIHYAVLLRVLILFPCIICSAKQIVFTNDFFSVGFVGLLGFSNGYLGTLSIMMVNEEVDESDLGMAGTFTGFFLNFGLVVGSTAALYVKDVLL